MDTWTEHDEALLQELEARKGRVTRARQMAVQEVVSRFHEYGMCSIDELAQALIDHADALIEVLGPFKNDIV